jgi:hypothetical protein
MVVIRDLVRFVNWRLLDSQFSEIVSSYSSLMPAKRGELRLAFRSIVKYCKFK